MYIKKKKKGVTTLAKPHTPINQALKLAFVPNTTCQSE